MVGLVAIAALAVLYVTPSDDYIFLPARAQPLAPKVEVEGEKPADDGGVYYVAVDVRKATLLERFFPGIYEGSTLVPGKDLIPPGLDEESRRESELAAMRRSQRVAASVALREAGYDVKATPTGVLVTAVFRDTPAVGKLRPGDVVEAVDGVRVRTPEQLGRRIRAKPVGREVVLRARRGSKLENVRLRTIGSPDDMSRPIVGIGIEPAVRITLPVDVDIDLGSVGGPSAGLAFALDILEELGHDVDHGRRLAATGELALDGRVGPVGGIKQKTIGARRSDVDVLLVPAGENAEEASRYAGDMRVIPVRTFRQALRALATLPEPS